MRIFKSILSALCAIIIVICSVVQFHHHDVHGRMVVFSTTEDVCCEAGHHHHEPINGINSGTCNHGCNDGHHQDEQKCSLKINIAKTEKETLSKIVIVCIKIADILCDTEIGARCEYVIPKSVPIQSLVSLSAKALRAPPVL